MWNDVLKNILEKRYLCAININFLEKSSKNLKMRIEILKATLEYNFLKNSRFTIAKELLKNKQYLPRFSPKR